MKWSFAVVSIWLAACGVGEVPGPPGDAASDAVKMDAAAAAPEPPPPPIATGKTRQVQRTAAATK